MNLHLIIVYDKWQWNVFSSLWWSGKNDNCFFLVENWNVDFKFDVLGTEHTSDLIKVHTCPEPILLCNRTYRIFFFLWLSLRGRGYSDFIKVHRCSKSILLGNWIRVFFFLLLYTRRNLFIINIPRQKSSISGICAWCK